MNPLTPCSTSPIRLSSFHLILLAHHVVRFVVNWFATGCFVDQSFRLGLPPPFPNPYPHPPPNS